MCHQTTSRVVCAALLLSLFVSGGEAQELAGSFEQLRVLVKPGDTVSVLDRAGQEVRGTISELSSSALAITVAGKPQALSRERHRRHPQARSRSACQRREVGIGGRRRARAAGGHQYRGRV